MPGKRQPVRDDHTSEIGDVLRGLLEQAVAQIRSDEDAGEPERDEGTDTTPAQGAEPHGRYDLDLADFPVFSFCKFSKSGPKHGGREPLVYTDTIKGRSGELVERTWKTYPGPFGFGGASTQATLFDLLQLYVEQGARGSQIQFGTLRSLFLRRSQRNPSKRDYERLRRDLDILRGYDFHCKNAFWDAKRRAYVDMNWRLFGSVFFFRATPDLDAEELPFGFIEVSPVLREIARTRGFFSLGFPSNLFHSLKPLEQRLSIYLSKKFVSQNLHRRFVSDLARALPVEATEEADVRKAIRAAAEGLLAKGVPTLAGFRFERSTTGRWLAAFVRKEVPRQDYATIRRAASELEPHLEGIVDRIVQTVGSDDDRLWWNQCARRLGAGPMDRAHGLLKEAIQAGQVRNRGALLTTFLKEIAKETGVVIQ